MYTYIIYIVDKYNVFNIVCVLLNTLRFFKYILNFPFSTLYLLPANINTANSDAMSFEVLTKIKVYVSDRYMSSIYEI